MPPLRRTPRASPVLIELCRIEMALLDIARMGEQVLIELCRIEMEFSERIKRAELVLIELCRIEIGA